MLCLGGLFGLALPKPAQADSVDDLVKWTFGPTRRGLSARKVGTDPLQQGLGSQLFWTPPPRGNSRAPQAKPLLSGCFHIDTILPLEKDSLLISGYDQLYLWERGKSAAPEPLSIDAELRTGAKAFWLLAYELEAVGSHRASARAGQEPAAYTVLAIKVNKEDKEGKEGRKAVLLSLKDRRVQSSPWRTPPPQTSDEYVQRFKVPHCKSVAAHCLVTAASLDQPPEYEIGARSKLGAAKVDPFLEFGQTPIEDAVWSNSGQQILFIQGGCATAAGR